MGGGGVPVVYDSVGRTKFYQSLDCLRPHGLLVTTGGWGADRAAAQEGFPRVFMAHEHYALLHRLASQPGAVR